MPDIELEYSDRYTALGIPYPNPATICEGQCEGMGCYPVSSTDMEEPDRSLWLAAESAAPADDGYHFVRCPDCNGTGKRPGGPVDQSEGKNS